MGQSPHEGGDLSTNINSICLPFVSTLGICDSHLFLFNSIRFSLILASTIHIYFCLTLYLFCLYQTSPRQCYNANVSTTECLFDFKAGCTLICLPQKLCSVYVNGKVSALEFYDSLWTQAYSRSRQLK